MATYSTKYNIGDVVFVFQPNAGYTNPTLMKTVINAIKTKATGDRVSIYYTLSLVRDEVPQCYVYSSIEEAKRAIRIEEYVK